MTLRGRVSNLHAVMPVTVRLRGQPDIALDFVVDTGFDGALSMPVAAVAALKLPFLEVIRVCLANETDVFIPVHVATILWQGAEKHVRVLASGKRPKLGTALLANYYLGIDFVEDGSTMVEPL